MPSAIIINNDLVISDDYLQITAVRSSGPGGQNVNKVSTCIELRFNPTKWGKLSHAALLRLLNLAKNKLDSEGNILLSGQRYREQYRNLEDVCERLKEMILKSLKSPKKRKKTKPTQASIEERIKKKKINSQKKQNRQKINNFE